MAIGSVEPLKELYARYGDRVAFVDVLTRQAHPGGSEREYVDFDRKLADARAYQREEGIPWPVVVDDLAGTVHQAWGGLGAPAFLIDADGRIAYACLWTAPKALGAAIRDLLDQGGVGVVRGGVRRMPELGPIVTDGWRGVRRGLPEGVLDLAVAMPGSPVVLWAGHQLRPLLAPVTLRSRPLLGTGGRAAVAVGLGLAALALILAARPRGAGWLGGAA